MLILCDNDLKTIIGGFNITGVLINAVNSGLKFIFDTGKHLGSALRRISGNNLCPLK